MKRFFAILLLGLASCKSSGGTWQHYRLSALDEARQRDMTIYLHFFQAGQPVCERQKSDLETLIKEKAFKNVGAYRVTYGTEKSLEKFFSITQACVLLVFKGETLKTRIASDVGPQLLRMSMEQGL